MKEIEQRVWYFCKRGACIEMRLERDKPYQGLYSTGAYQWQCNWISDGGWNREGLRILNDEVDLAEEYAYDNCSGDREDDDYRDLWISKLKELGWLETKLSFSYKAEVCDVQI